MDSSADCLTLLTPLNKYSKQKSAPFFLLLSDIKNTHLDISILEPFQEKKVIELRYHSLKSWSFKVIQKCRLVMGAFITNSLLETPFKGCPPFPLD